jgi:hypothetical protein
MSNLTTGEFNFCQFQLGQTGSFYTSLFKTILKSDENNRLKLMHGFPEEVAAVERFQNEMGYWQDLQHRFNRQFNQTIFKNIEKDIED